jgi:RNA polymerase sigma-70 factor (ECF subfamily)
MNLAPDAEEEWLRQVAGGDRSAFERLYRTYHRRLYGYLFRMMGASDIAEELTSDIMFEVWKSAGRFKGASRVSTWIFGIARHKALSAMRRGKPITVEVEEAVEIADRKELQDEVLVNQDMKDSINSALAKLTEQHREVMDLTFYQGFSCAEIADILQCPVNTVKTRMFYARKQLREILTGGPTT